MEIILGSASPRRKELLKQMGFEFQISVSQVDEKYESSMPAVDVAPYLAQLKANALKESITADQLLICCDTVVIENNQILGKPINENEAIQTLQRLSGKKHQVMSAVCMVYNNQIISFKETTEIEFKVLSLEEIEHYIKTYEPYDKAGSYGIQEWISHIGALRIEGSYTNVMGLPTHRLYQEIKKLKA